MKKHVKSNDYRKETIASSLKEASGGNRVTNVYQVSESEFQGDCMVGNRSGYKHLGTFTVTIKTCNDCGQIKDDVTSRVNPYALDVNGDDGLFFLCDKCEKTAGEDI